MSLSQYEKYEKSPDSSSICDHYISKLLSDSDITEEIVLNRLRFLTDNNKIKISQQIEEILITL